jgi:hypothetical protein
MLLPPSVYANTNVIPAGTAPNYVYNAHKYGSNLVGGYQSIGGFKNQRKSRKDKRRSERKTKDRKSKDRKTKDRKVKRKTMKCRKTHWKNW